MVVRTHVHEKSGMTIRGLAPPPCHARQFAPEFIANFNLDDTNAAEATSPTISFEEFTELRLRWFHPGLLALLGKWRSTSRKDGRASRFLEIPKQGLSVSLTEGLCRPGSIVGQEVEPRLLDQEARLQHVSGGLEHAASEDRRLVDHRGRIGLPAQPLECARTRRALQVRWHSAAQSVRGSVWY